MPTITQITVQRRSQERRNVFLDGAFAFGCNLNVIARFRLREGLVLSTEQVDEVIAGGVRQECFDAAMRLLESRLHSRAELKRKLGRKEFGPAVIDGVLDDLRRMNYLDDARFAASKATTAATRKHQGKRRAMAELLRSGVSTEVATVALNDVYQQNDSRSIARDLAMKQVARLKRLDVAVARRRLVGLLQRRGFDYETIKPVVEEVLGTFDDDSAGG